MTNYGWYYYHNGNKLPTVVVEHDYHDCSKLSTTVEFDYHNGSKLPSMAEYNYHDGNKWPTTIMYYFHDGGKKLPTTIVYVVMVSPIYDNVITQYGIALP